MTIVITVVLTTLDTSFYYFDEINGEKYEQVSDISFGIYGLSLLVSLGFLVVAICRISNLLR